MNQNPFLQVDYRLLQLNEVEHNGEKHKLTSQSKIVYSYLLSLSKSFDTVRPSLQGIADYLGLGSEQVARREIKTLTKAGLLTVNERPGTSNTFIVNPLPDMQEKTAQEAIAEVQEEKPADVKHKKESLSESITARFTPQMRLSCKQQDELDAEIKRLSNPLPNEKPIQRFKRSSDNEEIPF